MGRRNKCKGERKKNEPTVSGPFAETYWHLRRLARRRDLFILFDGDPEAPRFTFFDTTHGMPLLDYWPKSRRWAYANRPECAGLCDEHDIIAVAARLAGARRSASRRKADLSQFGPDPYRRF
jgi:hypothetical protein